MGVISPTIIAKIGDPFPNVPTNMQILPFRYSTAPLSEKSQHYCYRDGTIVSLYS